MPFEFFHLPAELRIRIYEYALISPEPICLQGYYVYWRKSPFEDARCYIPHTASDERKTPPVNLLLASKKTYNETSPILYSQNKFEICDPGIYNRQSKRARLLTWFLLDIGAQNAACLRYLKIHFPDELVTFPASGLFTQNALDLVREMCPGLRTVEVNCDMSNITLGDMESRLRRPRREEPDFVTVIDACLRAIPSLRTIVVSRRNNSLRPPLSPIVTDRMRELGWVVSETVKGNLDDFF